MTTVIPTNRLPIPGITLPRLRLLLGEAEQLPLSPELVWGDVEQLYHRLMIVPGALVISRCPPRACCPRKEARHAYRLVHECVHLHEQLVIRSWEGS